MTQARLWDGAATAGAVVRGAARRPPHAAGARRLRGAAAQAAGRAAEGAAEIALAQDGWSVFARRLRTPAGEIDLVAERDGLLAFVEVKARPDLARAAEALGARQRARLLAAAEIVLAANPGWGGAGVRFDVMLVEPAGQVRRIADAFRQE
jgi:putative endonuclease